MKQLREENDQHPDAIMQIPPEQGQFMSFLVKALGVRKALEIGTFTGYSTLCVALSLPDDGKVVACDINEAWASVGRECWKKAGVEHKIDFRLGPAIDTLESLIESGESGTFDFAFIDADKGSYGLYYEKCMALLRRGGVIAIDNVLLLGSVVDPGVLDADLRRRISDSDIDVMRKLNEKIRNDPRVEETMLPLADGLTLALKL